MAKHSALDLDRWKLVMAVVLLLALALALMPPARAEKITLTSDPDCVSRAVDVIDCFARGADHAMWHISWTAGTWSTWTSLGGGFHSGPSATSWGPDRLDVFASGEDDKLWHISWDGTTWSDWEPIASPVLTSDPDCVAGLVGGSSPRIDCFARGTTDAIYHTVGLFGAPQTTWSLWESLGGGFNFGPTAISPNPFPCQGGSLCLIVFAGGQDDHLWVDYYKGGTDWTGWGDQGIFLISDPEAVVMSGGWGCFFKGADNTISYKWFPIASQPGSLGLPPSGVWKSGPAAVSRDGKSVDVFAVGSDNVLYHNTGTTGWSGWEAVPMTVGQVATFTHILITPTGTTATTTTSSTASSSANPVTVTDWAVLSVALDPPNPQAGVGVTFTASLALLSSSVPLPQTVDVQCQLDGQSCGAGSITYPGPVGQPSTVHTQSPWVATVGTHTLTWSIGTTNDPNPANNAMSISFTVQSSSTSQSLSTTETQPSATSTTGSTLPATVVLTQTVTQQPTSTTSQATSQPGILDILQQNSLLIVGALGLLVIALAIATMKRGKHDSQATPNQEHR